MCVCVCVHMCLSVFETSPDFVLVELLDIVSLVGHQEQEGVALFAGTSSPTYAMNVVDRCPGGCVLHDPVHPRKVKSSRSNILTSSNTCKQGFPQVSTDEKQGLYITKIFLALVDINRLPSSDGKQGPYITYKDIFGSSRYKQASNRFPMMKSKGLTLHTKTSVLIAAAHTGNSKASRFCGLAPGARSKSNMLRVTQEQGCFNF